MSRSYEAMKAHVDALIPDHDHGSAEGARDLILGATIIEDLLEDPAFNTLVCLIAAAMFRRHSFLEMGTSNGRRAAESVGKMADALAAVSHALMKARATDEDFDLEAVWQEAAKALGNA